MKRVNLELPEEDLARVDELRGDVPRNAWIRRAIQLRIDFHNVSPEAIERLIADWEAASELRQIEGASDDIDREIALRTSSRKEAPNGA